jgi:hypothetical protein
LQYQTQNIGILQYYTNAINIIGDCRNMIAMILSTALDPNTSVNPWEEFKAEYEAWRTDNPCPATDEIDADLYLRGS